MQSGQFQFKLDTPNLIKAGTIPVIVAAIGGALWLLGFLGGLLGILFWVVALFAGYWYVNLILKSGEKPNIINVVINAAILGLVVGLVYGIVSWIAISIRFTGPFGIGFGFTFGQVIGDAIQAAIGSAIGAGGWYAYKSGMIKTS